MTDERDLAAVRRAYARQMTAIAGIEDAAVERAFATVPRERFLGDAPWSMMRGGGRPRRLPANDPAYVYQDMLFPLDPARGVNNGSPSLHAFLLHHLAVRTGERVAHIGAGTGYYTAILAEIVGAAGRIEAVEVDATLAEAARRNLAAWPHVEVVEADGAMLPAGEVDAVYVSFAVTDLPDAWVERLALGGRLVVPVVGDVERRRGETTGTGHGSCFLIGREATGLSARHLGPVAFVCAEGALAAPVRDPEVRPARREADRVRSLVWKRPIDPTRTWLTTPRWSLSFDPTADDPIPGDPT